MKLKWLGTAGFEIQTNGQSFLVDPFLSRNKTARPIQNLKPDDFKTIRRIFISHGHFDHLMDVPEIAAISNCEIFCSITAKKTLQRKQTNTNQIQTIQKNRIMLDFEHYKAQAFFSTHIQFDKKLILSSLLKTNIRIFKYLPLFKPFPCGQVLSWRFFIEDKIIQFFGSGGSTRKELDQIKKESPIDILLLPLQGHSDIFEIGITYIRYLKPKIVIIQHHDDFYPPLSQSIKTQNFVEKVKKTFNDTQVIVPRINEPMTF